VAERKSAMGAYFNGRDFDHYVLKHIEIPGWDPFGPVKFDAPDIIRNLHVLEERMKNIEEHLVAGGKQAFVRIAERPAMDSQTAVLRSLHSRLEALEQRLGTSKG
jgi:hypothetical protein